MAMRGKLYVIRSHNRAFLRDIMGRAPEGYEVIVREPTRTLNQNDALWGLLTDVANAKPQGRHHTPETWKALFLHALGHAARFEMGLNGEPFPVGFRSSHLSKAQMSDLIEFIRSWCAENNVELPMVAA